MRTKKKKLLRGIRLGVLFAALAAVLLLLFFRYRKAAGEQEQTIPFRFDQYSDNSFSLIGRGLLVVSDLSYSVFDANGELLTERIHNYNFPLFEASGDCAVLWSQEGGTATVISGRGDAVTVSPGGTVMGADVNGSGWSVCISDENGSKGLVTAANQKGEQVFRLHMGSSYPVDADILQDNTRVAVLSLQKAGCHVGVYEIGTDGEQAGWTDDEEFYYELEALSGGNLLLLGRNKAVFLDSRCRFLGEYLFEGDDLRDYVFSGEGFVALLLGRSGKTGSARLVTVGTDGAELASRELSEEVEGMNADGKCLSVRHSVQTVLYNASLQEYARLESASDILASLVRSDGSAIIVSGGIAALFQPG